MSDFPANDFAMLCSVHEFFLKVLSKRLRHEVPLPAGVGLRDGMAADPQSVAMLRHWLHVLDLAMSPPMFRDELESEGEDTAACLLKFYSANSEHLAVDRDKTDFVVTWLCRHSQGSVAGAFEKRIAEITGQSAPLAEEYRQLLREFKFLQEEADRAAHFDELMDSSIVQRVRDIKASFGASFYHPTVLATVAAYNIAFGKRFDELFKEATRQIKAFAQGVQQEGGNVLARVEGDLTVKQLGELEEQKILKTDYREAQEQFRKVSKIKKAVDSKRKRTSSVSSVIVPTPPSSTPIRTMAEAKAAAQVSAMQGHISDDDRLAFIVPSESTMALQMEQSKLLTLADSIRGFVKAADTGNARIVPLKHGTITLAPHEEEAFRVDYVAEKSFRADFANLVMKIVACCARIDAEMLGYRNTQASAYLWKPHADSLTNLVRNSKTLNVEANQLKATAMQRGLASKAENMDASLLKMQEKVKVATSTLARVGGE